MTQSPSPEQMFDGLQRFHAGDWAQWWPLYEARLQAKPSPQLPWPRWTGESLSGKRLAIWPEQGLGDKIQLARFIPQLLQMGAELSIFVEPVLVDLFEAHFPECEIVACSGPANFQDPDYWIEWFSLPLRLGVTPETLPGTPYLRPPSTGPALPSDARFGVVTAGNATHPNDANRSLPPAVAQRLLSLPGAVSLQPADSGAKSFGDTAFLISQLERVITVDTAVAHLAGAMGAPVDILLPAVGTDWRWGSSGDRSPWYPSARLWRQPAAGRWGEAVDDLLRAQTAGLTATR